MTSLYVRARLAYAVAGRELADLGRGAVGDVSTPMPPGALIRKARRPRLVSLTLVDRAVLAELSQGTSWEVVADALGLDLDAAIRRYGPVWDQWSNGDLDDDAADFGDHGLGLRGDLDAEGTADSLDQWYRRHAEPWEDHAESAPVAQVLVDGEASPGDR